MKAKIYRTSQDEIKKYRESDALGQSELKELLQGLGPYKAYCEKKKDKEKEKPKSYLTIGSAVDILLTGDPKDFDEIFYVSDFEDETSDTEKKLIEAIFNKTFEDLIDTIKLEDCHSMLAEVAVEQDWYKGKPGDNRIKTLLAKGSPYFENLKQSKGKTILSSNEYMTVLAVKDSIAENPKTFKYFNNPEELAEDFHQLEFDEVELHFQKPLYCKVELAYMEVGAKRTRIDAKALLDLLIIFKKGEKIVKLLPVDIKTMSGYTPDFPAQMRTYRYDIQAAWYTYLLMTVYDCELQVVAPFRFIVESTISPGNPLVYEITREVLNIGRYGKSETKDSTSGTWTSYPLKGYLDLLEEYVYYVETNWEEDIRLRDKGERIPLGWYQIEKLL